MTQVQETFGTPRKSARRHWPVALASALLALAAFALLHLRGTPITPDGWAYWQGAISLSEGAGYQYFSGHPIVAWPPMYPLYLAVWTVMLGPTAWGLVIANGLLVAFQAGVWTWVILAIARDGESEPASLAVWSSGAYTGLFAAFNQTAPLAHVLTYTVLAPAFFAAYRASFAATRPAAIRWLAIYAAGATTMLLTHNHSVVFVAALTMLIAINGRAKLMNRQLLAATLVPFAIWMTSRWLLGQLGSHLLAPGLSQYGVVTYAAQLVHGLGNLVSADLLASPKVALLPFALAVLVSLRRPRSTPHWFGFHFVVVSTTATLALFAVTWIADPLNGRFLLAVPLVLVPLALLGVTAARPWAGAVVITLALLPLGWAILTTAGRSRDLSVEALGFPERFVPYGARLSRDYTAGPPVDTAEGWLVAPIAWREGSGPR